MGKSKKIKTSGYRFTKTRIILFLVLCAIVCATLPFSGWFEDQYNNYLTKDYGNYTTAIDKDLVVHVIDVGNADCIAIEFPDGKKGLIDAGVSTGALGDGYKTKAVEYIKNNVFDGVENGTFDFFILTHADADHCNNAVNIFGSFQFKRIYRPTMFYYNATGDTNLNQQELERAKEAGYVSSSIASLGDATNLKCHTTKTYANCIKSIYDETYTEDGITKGAIVKFNYTGGNDANAHDNNTDIVSDIGGTGYEMKYRSPNYLKYTENNDYSPVIILKYNGKSICLTGDAEEGVEKYLTDNNKLEKVDVLKVGHHGGNTSSKSYFLNALKPTYAFISCNNSDNKYGHPNAKVISRLQECGVSSNNILNTKENGTLVFAVDNAGEMFIATSDGFIFVRIKWWYVCGTALIIGASIIFGIGASKKKKKASVNLNLSSDGASVSLNSSQNTSGTRTYKKTTTKTSTSKTGTGSKTKKSTSNNRKT